MPTYIEFIHANPELVEPENAMAFLSDDGGETYNRCHCKYIPFTFPSNFSLHFRVSVWSNFEIGDLDFWRGEAYRKFFDFLDEQGGFYYEVGTFINLYLLDAINLDGALKIFPQRWGDAPVHSIGAALFAKKEEIHFFNDIGSLLVVLLPSQ